MFQLSDLLYILSDIYRLGTFSFIKFELGLTFLKGLCEFVVHFFHLGNVSFFVGQPDLENTVLFSFTIQLKNC